MDVRWLKGTGRKEKEVVPWRALTWAEKRKASAGEEERNKPEAGQERTVPPKPEEVTFSKRRRGVTPAWELEKNPVARASKCTEGVKRRESQARGEATPVKNKGRAR